VKFIVNGGSPMGTMTTSSGCVTPFGTPVTDEDSVVVRVSQKNDDGSRLTLSAPVGLTGNGFGGSGSGAPTCAGDLVTGDVTCRRLKPGTFTVSRARGAVTAPFTLVQNDDGAGGTTVPGGLQAGDTVTLKKQGGTRAITTLRLSTLRLDFVDGVVTGGSCQPRLWLGDPSGPNGICPQNGSLPLASGSTSQLDDLGGGATTVFVPDFDTVIPSYGDSVGGSFQAYVDIFGPTPTTMTLTIFHRNANGTNGSQAGGPINLDPSAGGAVTGLAQGRYNAVWALTDTQGDGTHDTRTQTTQFAVQPGGAQGAAGSTGAQGAQGPAGSQGAAGAQGAQGPAGPDGPKGAPGRDAQVTCKVTAAKGKKPPKVTCTVKFKAPAGKVMARLTRGRHVYATGKASHGKLVLTARRRLHPGTYTLTLIGARGSSTFAAHVVVR
jgi:hypothetical protein